MPNKFFQYNGTNDVILPYILVDEKLQIIKVNTQATEVLGECLLKAGDSFLNFFKNNFEYDFTSVLNKVNQLQEPVQFFVLSEKKHNKLKGTISKFNSTYDVIFQDISEELAHITQLTESRNQLQTILDRSDCGIVLLTPDFKVMAFNSSAKQAKSGSLGKELHVGANFNDFMQTQGNKVFNEAFINAVKGEFFKGEIDIELNANTYWFKIQMNPFFAENGVIIGVMLAYSNITDAKLNELDNLKIINNLIERNRNLEQFNYIISHNTRSSLITLSELTKLLKTDLSENEKQYVYQGIEESVKKLDNTIIDIADVLNENKNFLYAKLEIDLNKILKLVKETIGTSITKDQIVFNIDFTKISVIKSIKPFIQSIFYNLITNSIKYKRSDVSPEISIWTEQVGNNALFYFKDNGLGFDLKKNKEKLFGLYNRFNLEIEGKGMGLFMVKTQVNALGGTIDIESELNKGTLFKITLPLA